jgi:hypothetical protein
MTLLQLNRYRSISLFHLDLEPVFDFILMAIFKVLMDVVEVSVVKSLLKDKVGRY